jgi:hypothetical protein
LPGGGSDHTLDIDNIADAITVQIGTTAGTGTESLVDCVLNI